MVWTSLRSCNVRLNVFNLLVCFSKGKDRKFTFGALSLFYIRRAWKGDEKKILCAGVRACSSSIAAITIDENDMVWVGSDKGDVRRLGLVSHMGSNGIIYKVQLHRYLRHTGAGVPERSVDADLGMEYFDMK